MAAGNYAEISFSAFSGSADGEAGNDFGTSFDIDGTYFADANQPIQIVMAVFVSCHYCTGYPFDPSNGYTDTATVTAPALAIDPDFANASEYSIIYSAGLPSAWTGGPEVPEPGTLALLVTTLGSLGLAGWRRRGRRVPGAPGRGRRTATYCAALGHAMGLAIALWSGAGSALAETISFTGYVHSYQDPGVTPFLTDPVGLAASGTISIAPGDFTADIHAGGANTYSYTEFFDQSPGASTISAHIAGVNISFASTAFSYGGPPCPCFNSPIVLYNYNFIGYDDPRRTQITFQLDANFDGEVDAGEPSYRADLGLIDQGDDSSLYSAYEDLASLSPGTYSNLELSNLAITDAGNYVVDISMTSVTIAAAPEPLSVGIFATGVFGLGLVRRRRKTRARPVGQPVAPATASPGRPMPAAAW